MYEKDAKILDRCSWSTNLPTANKYWRFDSTVVVHLMASRGEVCKLLNVF